MAGRMPRKEEALQWPPLVSVAPAFLYLDKA